MVFSKTEKDASLFTDLKLIFLGFGNFFDLDPDPDLVVEFGPGFGQIDPDPKP